MATDGSAAGRRLMLENTDARAVRTRQKLVSAFHDAVRDAHPSEMSVASLTRAAGVNRTSFYTHFSSPQDLAVHALSDLFDVVGRTDVQLRSGHVVSGAEASRRAVHEIVYFVHARRDSYARLLGPGAPPRLVEAVAAAFTERSRATLEAMDNRPADADPLITAQFLAGGVLTVLGNWLGAPRPRWSRDRLIAALVQCLPAWLNSD